MQLEHSELVVASNSNDALIVKLLGLYIVVVLAVVLYLVHIN